ncbi:6-bladed beta-propeller [Algoriphagus limi]|uniref:6-bladed beta-propeller n=1 Tax=Algoriphagus limi TaxID=2975273 RepID=A0ABT2GBN5_9BACT|nr:6-bladed beta-propeller [Algoriphagus limi]MCS5491347.1 6-bladed beta-propeller [Algoriphagus limi]
MRKYFILITIICWMGCKSEVFESNEFDDSPTIIDLSDNKNFEESDFFDLFSIDEIIELQLPEGSYLGSLRRFEIFDDHLFALDPSFNNLAKFDLKGNYITQIGRIGEGPDEIPEIVDFSIDSKTGHIGLASYSQMKISRYDQNGNFVEATKIGEQIDQLAIFDNKLCLSLTYFNTINRNFGIYSFTGDSLSTHFPFPNDMFPMGLLNISGHLTKSNSGILFNEPASSIIYSFSNDLLPYKKYRFERNNELWPEEKRHDLNGYFQSLATGRLTFLRKYYEENKDYLIFSINLAQSGTPTSPVDPRLGYYNKKTNKTFLSRNADYLKHLEGPIFANDEYFFMYVQKYKFFRIIQENETFEFNLVSNNVDFKNLNENEEDAILVLKLKIK